MKESQRIIFKMALDKLKRAIPRQEIISGAALGLHMDKKGNKIENKYSGWATESSIMTEELNEAMRLFQIISDENPITA